MFRKLSILMTMAVLSATLVFAQGQQPQPLQLSPEAQQLLQQYTQLKMQLEDIQRQAMSDEKVAEVKDELDQKIQAAMIENDPSVEQLISEREQITLDYKTAKDAGNQEQVSALEQQYRDLMAKLQPAQQAVVQQPEISSEIEDYQNMVEDKMAEINPNSQNMISQMAELKTKIMNIQQQNNSGK